MPHTQLLQQICNHYNIAPPKESPILLSMSGMHPVWQLSTENKKFALKYYDHELGALYAQNLLPLETVEQIAAFMVQNNIPTITALPGKTGYEFKIEQGSFFLYEWIEAEHKLDQQISPDHARQVGDLLCHIHNLNDLITDLPKHLITSEHLMPTLQIFQNNYPGVLISEELINLKNWHEQSLNQNSANDQLVFSHRDIMPANIFWLSDEELILLDWEFCGYIHKDLDVFITALNWSYVTSGQIDFNLFSSVLEGYLSKSVQILFRWDDLLFEYYAYVLHWIEFNLKRAVYSPAQYQQAIAEVKKSYIAMNCVTKNYESLSGYTKI